MINKQPLQPQNNPIFIKESLEKLTSSSTTDEEKILSLDILQNLSNDSGSCQMMLDFGLSILMDCAKNLHLLHSNENIGLHLFSELCRNLSASNANKLTNSGFIPVLFGFLTMNPPCSVAIQENVAKALTEMCAIGQEPCQQLVHLDFLLYVNENLLHSSRQLQEYYLTLVWQTVLCNDNLRELSCDSGLIATLADLWNSQSEHDHVRYLLTKIFQVLKFNNKCLSCIIDKGIEVDPINK